MKCLSVQQPWAWLLAHGHKDIENRTWETKVRGWVLLHAGKTIDLHAQATLTAHHPELRVPDVFAHARGAIIGAMEIDDCWPPDSHIRPGYYSPWWSRNQFGFHVSNSIAFKNPVPWRGMLGFFTVDFKEPAAADILAQLPRELQEGAR
jgi:hypothetical protein